MGFSLKVKSGVRSRHISWKTRLRPTLGEKKKKKKKKKKQHQLEKGFGATIRLFWKGTNEET